MNTFNPITRHAAEVLQKMQGFRLASWGVAAFVAHPRGWGEVEIKPDARGLITLARVKAALRAA